jgi:hypothetical protein
MLSIGARVESCQSFQELIYDHRFYHKADHGGLRSNAGIVGLNPAQGMDVCVPFFFMLLCVCSGLATG